MHPDVAVKLGRIKNVNFQCLVLFFFSFISKISHLFYSIMNIQCSLDISPAFVPAHFGIIERVAL